MRDAPLPAPAPRVDPETQPFWEATASARLLLPRCNECATVIWYPRPICPDCSGVDIEWFHASGRGSIYSFTINHRGEGEYRDASPYVLAYVQLEEGPRILTNMVGCDGTALRINDPVVAVYHDTGSGTSLVRFIPDT